MSSSLQLFNALRVNGVLQALIQDPRLLPQKPIWKDRIPDVKASEDEIMARFYGTLLIADLVADDAAAGVYSQGAFQLERGPVPNIKIGVALNQKTINLLARLQQYGGNAMDMQMFGNWQAAALLMALNGVEQRKEQLRIAMLMDGLNYDRLGIKIKGQGWGMYSDLKLTVNTSWDNVSATPITDIQTTRRIARIRYGINLNRLTLSTAALQNAVKTTEFQNQVKAFGYGFGGIPIPAIPLQDDQMLQTLLGKIIGGTGGSFIIEIDDRRYWTQDTFGVITNTPFQPVNVAILTSTDNDGNAMAWDFAQGMVTESILAGVAPINIVGSMPMSYGPMAYVTSSDANANPPGIVHWAVDRGFPRKHMLQASAALNVGTFTDPISTAVPLPQ